jgi:ferrous iron transport protein A
MTLLAPGQTARIAAVLGAAEQTQRLRELGLRDGAEVEMVRPGSPCIIRLGGQKLGLRSEEIARVLVRP